MTPESESIPLVVLISGISGGTGSSSAARVLSKILDVPKHSPGNEFRKVAFYFEDYFSDITPTQKNWDNFSNFVLDQSPESVSQIAQYEGQHPSEKILSQFRSAQATFTKHNPKQARQWERYVDEAVAKQIIQNEQGVFEGKLTAIIDRLELTTEESSILGDFPEFSIPFIRTILTVDPDTGARRIKAREQQTRQKGWTPKLPQISLSGSDQQSTEKVKTAVTQRIEADWQRYTATYRIQGSCQELSLQCLEDLENEGHLKIDTTDKNKGQVVGMIVQHIINQLTFFQDDRNERAGEVLALLLAKLDSLSSNPEFQSYLMDEGVTWSDISSGRSLLPLR